MTPRTPQTAGSSRSARTRTLVRWSLSGLESSVSPQMRFYGIFCKAVKMRNRTCVARVIATFHSLRLIPIAPTRPPKTCQDSSLPWVARPGRERGVVGRNQSGALVSQNLEKRQFRRTCAEPNIYIEPQGLLAALPKVWTVPRKTREAKEARNRPDQRPF